MRREIRSKQRERASWEKRREIEKEIPIRLVVRSRETIIDYTVVKKKSPNW